MSRPLRWWLPGALLAAAVIIWFGSRQAPVQEEVRVTAGDFPRRVTLGRDELVLPSPPQRVVLGSTAAVDLAAALVEPARVVAVCDQAFTWSSLAQDPRGFAAVPLFHEYLAESMLALRPDLVLCNRFSAQATTAQLRDAGIPVVPLDHARDLERALVQVELVGRILGAEARAAAVVADARHRVGRLAQQPGRRHGLRALTYVNHGTGAWTNGRACMADELLRLAGMRNAGAEAGSSDVWRLTTEELLALDPDLIVVTERVGQAQDPSEALLRGDPNLQAMRAVRSGRIVRVHPLALATTSHEIVAAAEQLVERVEALLGGEPR